MEGLKIMKKRVLIIEDEKKIARFLELELTYEGYNTEVVYNGQEGLKKAQESNYDIILLDIMLPELNGMEVCRQIRQNSSVPIIMVTAKDEVTDKVFGLDSGADDYLTKPFAIEELLARMRANLRKKKNDAEQKDELKFSDLVMDVNTREVWRNGEKIKLTKREYDLLKYLLINQRVVLSREQISRKVWGYDFEGNTNIVDVYIRYLRSKIDDPYDTKLIHTVRGVGYVLKEES